MNKIILWKDGSWQWEPMSSELIRQKNLPYVTLTIGENWNDWEVSRMVRDYFHENLDWIFSQEI